MYIYTDNAPSKIHKISGDKPITRGTTDEHSSHIAAPAHRNVGAESRTPHREEARHIGGKRWILLIQRARGRVLSTSPLELTTSLKRAAKSAESDVIVRSRQATPWVILPPLEKGEGSRATLHSVIKDVQGVALWDLFSFDEKDVWVWIMNAEGGAAALFTEMTYLDVEIAFDVNSREPVGCSIGIVRTRCVVEASRCIGWDILKRFWFSNKSFCYICVVKWPD